MNPINPPSGETFETIGSFDAVECPTCRCLVGATWQDGATPTVECGDEHVVTWSSPVSEPAETPRADMNPFGMDLGGACCVDAMNVGDEGQLHTGGCPNRCSVVTTFDMPPGGYACALTVGHTGDHWIHPGYRTPCNDGCICHPAGSTEHGTQYMAPDIDCPLHGEVVEPSEGWYGGEPAPPVGTPVVPEAPAREVPEAVVIDAIQVLYQCRPHMAAAAKTSDLVAAFQSVWAAALSLLQEETAAARKEGIRIGREAAAMELIEVADNMTPSTPAARTLRRHLRTAAQIAANTTTPERVAAALESLAQPPFAVACHLDAAGQPVSDGR